MSNDDDDPRAVIFRVHGEVLRELMGEPVIPKFVPAPGGFVLNPARREGAGVRLRWREPALCAPAEGLLDRIMREHFARTVR